MIRKIAIACMLGLMTSVGSAQSPTVDEASQKLAECVAAKATTDDKALLSKWAAVEIASSGPAAGAVTVDAEKKVALDKDTARIFTRLVMSDCLDLAKPVAKQGGGQAFRAAGAALSRLAMRELIASPGVNSAIVRSYVSNLNQQDFLKLVQK